MPPSTILLPTEFDTQNIKFLSPRTNKLGGQSVLINYASEENTGPFIFQTSRVRVPFGIDQNTLDSGAAPKYNLSISLANDETQNEQLKQLTKNIRNLDNLAKEFPVKDTTWFNKTLSEEVVKEFFKSAEKFPKDSKWPSTLKIKLPFDRKGNPEFTLFDEKRNKIEVFDKDGNFMQDVIPKGSEAVLLIQPTNVWFVGKTQYGIGYKLVQAKIFKSSKITEYSIVDEESEAEEEAEKSASEGTEEDVE